MTQPTVRLTMAQALVRWLTQQFTEIDGVRVPAVRRRVRHLRPRQRDLPLRGAGGLQDRLPTWRGQNEQSMALAAIGFAKAKRRRQIMIATSSIGPGALNMVTAAGAAHANRLPVLLLSGDTFTNRLPDPVLQQVEHFGDPTVTVNDAFRAVTRYWDRITHPEQILSSLPQAVAAMLDPADCGPAFLALPQDIQEMAFDYPQVSSRSGLEHSPAAPGPPQARRSGGGAEDREEAAPHRRRRRALFARREGRGRVRASSAAVPIVETIAGKGGVTHDHPDHIGPIGIFGSTSANALAAEADVVLAVGTRLQISPRARGPRSPRARFVSINAARFDADKHRALAVVGDALETVNELDAALGDWRAEAAHMERAQRAVQGMGRAARQASGADQCAGSNLRADRRRGARRSGGERHADLGGRRPAGRGRQGLARQGAEHVRPGIRLLLHGL